MDETTLKVGMAGFFHDIGKCADREAMGVSERYFNDNAGIYLPFRDGRYTHHHALYTAFFIEQMKDLLPPELNSRAWGVGDSFINLAAGHHNPETPMQQIIAVADRLTSGIDRQKFENAESQPIGYRDYKRTRLLPLFEQLAQPAKQNADDFAYEYPLRRLSPLGIFPEKRGAIDKQEAEEEYLELYEQFVADLGHLRHKEENISLWFEHFDHLMMVYTSCIPQARVGRVVHDVSLYDHSRLTAAFAASLYRYHAATDTLKTEAISNEKDEKFLMVSGNFYGIQSFIFSSHGDTRKYTAKMLRGRSFYVALLSEIAADRLCMELGLPHISVIFNAAGKFTVLAPNTQAARTAVEKVKDEVNDWLYRISFGEMALGLSTVSASQRDFLPDRFQELWDAIAARGEENKFRKIDLGRYGGAVEGYLGSFRNDLERPLCPLCGRRPAAIQPALTAGKDDIGPVCRICRDQVFLGTRIVRENEMLILNAPEGTANAGQLMEPILGSYQVKFGGMDPGGDGDFRGIRKHWDISSLEEHQGPGRICRKLLNRYVPRYQEERSSHLHSLTSKMSEKKKTELFEELRVGDPLPFHVISLMSRNVGESGNILGLDALGILKADVDNLGMLMASGLEKERFTISRLAALSRQLNYYFALYLPHLLMTDTRFRDVYTVFAGGDDLFVIGPWNRIYELSLHIHDSFSEYTCRNEAVHLSAGIVLKKAHAPLNALAESAEAALESSKSAGRNSFTMFAQTTPWQQVAQLEEVRVTLEDWFQKGWVNKSMLHRLNEFIVMTEQEHALEHKKQITMSEMSCFKWRALFSYAAARNIARGVKDSDKRDPIVRELSATMAGWLDKLSGSLRIPLWNILYNNR
ncbi:MAG: type III-A CRISPR-associated protein Cas10/Csm1 [Deltaproteobacteria bacterium]|nr:type III-A CRISPR-associated protein Cas10/Csm1 [Deltaproteobacteria bacterium]